MSAPLPFRFLGVSPLILGDAGVLDRGSVGGVRGPFPESGLSCWPARLAAGNKKPASWMSFAGSMVLRRLLVLACGAPAGIAKPLETRMVGGFFDF